MTASTDDLVGFIRNYREPVSIVEAASELALLGNHGALWPKATEMHWRREITTLAATGVLKIDLNGMVSVPVDVDGHKQMTLF